MRVGFVGAGRMGTPMVRRLAAAGHDVAVLARTSEKASAITELGAQPVSACTEAARGADSVVVCVFTDEQVRQVCLDFDLLDAMPARSVLVLHTTCSPRTAEAVAERAADRGVEVVDAPVSGGPHEVAAGTVTLFVGGADDAVAKASFVLGCYGDPVLHVGPLGAGQRVKLVNNTLFAAQIALVAEAVRLAGRLGVDERALLSALQHGSANSHALNLISAAGSAAGFIAPVSDFIGKDLALVRATVDELGGDLGLIGSVVETGFGGPDFRASTGNPGLP